MAIRVMMVTVFYNAYVEVNNRDSTHIDKIADDLMDRLAEYHPSIGMSPRDWLSVHISLPAETLSQATTTALAVVKEATRAEPIACEIMTEAEFDAREGFGA